MILSVNLMVFVVSYLTNGDSDLMIPCGIIAVAVGVPIFVPNLIWIGRPHAVPGENIAVRNRVGAWRLISANQVLSLLIWCGHPLVSIIGITVNL